MTPAIADAPPISDSSQLPYQDVQLPPEDVAPGEQPAGDGPDGPSGPPPFSSGENRLVADYLAKKLTATEFTALGVSAAVGGPLPIRYQDGGADGNGNDESRGHDGNDNQQHANTGGPASSPPPLVALAGAGSVSSVAGSAPVGDGADRSVFLDYVFAVAATESAADQAQFASAFTPVTADAAPVAAPAAVRSALTATPAASGNCAHVTTIDIGQLIHYVSYLIPPGILKAKLPKKLPFSCVAITAHFRVYYSLASTDGKNGVPTASTSGDGVPDYIDHVTGSLEEAYAKYKQMGYLQPSGQVTVLISSLYGAMGNDAGFTPPPVAGRQFIVMDNQGSEFYLPRHELFHTFQYRYIAVLKYAISLQSFESMNWWMEATAEWAAHQSLAASTMSLIAADGTSERTAYDQKLPAFLGTPDQNLNKSTKLGGQSRQYGAFILAEYLSGRFDTAVVLHTWQHIGNENGLFGTGLLGTYPVHAINETIAGYGSSTQAELPKFAKAIYQLGPDAGGTTVTCVFDYGVSPLDGTGGCATEEYPVTVSGGGISSNQFQFNDPDLTDWIHQLIGDKRTAIPAGDPSPLNFRPAHTVRALNYLGYPNGIDALDNPAPVNVRLSHGGMSFTDITWNTSPDSHLLVSVSAPKNTQLHASLISWSAYRTRCGPDQDVNVPAGGHGSLTGPSLGGCAFSTLILTDTKPGDAQDSSGHTYQWISQFDSVVPV